MESKKCPNLTNLSQVWLKSHYFDINLWVWGTFLSSCVRSLISYKRLMQHEELIIGGGDLAKTEDDGLI